MDAIDMSCPDEELALSELWLAMETLLLILLDGKSQLLLLLGHGSGSEALRSVSAWIYYYIYNV